MEKISVFNYEAYYLDYLEGNLSEGDIKLLLAFLDEYPECKVMDCDLPKLKFEDSQVFENKKALKEFDSKEAITLANLDHFLIESSEKVISPSKDKELAAFISANSLQTEQTLSNAVYFAPESGAVYMHKESLKQKRAIVLWPYAATAAAACIILLMLLWNPNSGSVIEPNNGVTAIKEKGSVTPEIEKEFVNPNQISNDEPGNNIAQNTPQKQNIEDKRTNKKLANVDQMSRNPVRQVVANLNEKELEPITKRTYVDALNESIPKTSPDDYASIHFADMNNPIEPLTKVISKKTNTPIDFRRQKASKKRAGGFFIKVGKFELSRKKHR